MPKTYGTVTTFTAGSVLTASQLNVASTAVNNLVVPPMCRVSYSTTFSVPNNTHTACTHTSSNSTKDIDTDGMITLSAVASNVTIQTAGVYLVSATADFAANATGVRLARIIRSRSGVETMIATSTVAPSGGGTSTAVSVSGIVECAVNDLILLAVYQNSGGALNLQAIAQYAGTLLCATWIGRTS